MALDEQVKNLSLNDKQPQQQQQQQKQKKGKKQTATGGEATLPLEVRFALLVVVTEIR